MATVIESIPAELRDMKIHGGVVVKEFGLGSGKLIIGIVCDNPAALRAVRLALVSVIDPRARLLSVLAQRPAPQPAFPAPRITRTRRVL